MIDASLFLQLMLYILGSILLIVLIILGIKLIITMNKIENIVDDINGKVRSLNGIFSVIDMTTDKLALLSDKTICFIIHCFQLPPACPAILQFLFSSMMHSSQM